MKQKKFSCLAAAAVLALCFASCSSDSDSGGTKSTLPDLSGAGTAGAPFLVSSAADLLKVGKGPDGNWTPAALSAHYELTSDIDMSLVTDWQSIGFLDLGSFDEQNPDWSATFTGSFDGAGFKISNLNINSTSSLSGLFGAVGPGGVVKNLGLDSSVDIKGKDFVGGIAALNLGTIENCYVAGKVSSTDTDSNDHDKGCAGIAGASDRISSIKNCYVTGNIAGNHKVAGIVGDNGGTIESCYVTGDITGNGTTIGGVAGNHEGTMKNCYVTGNVTGDREVGGIAGKNGGGSAGTIKNCYATGNVTVTNGPGGGIAGANRDRASIENCVALNATITTADLSGTGRVVGKNESSDPLSLSDNYARDNMVMTVTGYSVVAGADKKDGADVSAGTLAGQYNNATFWSGLGWDLTNIWEMTTGAGNLPKLKGQ